MLTVDGFIFMGTNSSGLSKSYTFVGFKIHDHSSFFHNSYRKSFFVRTRFRGLDPPQKNMEIGIPRKLSHPQYIMKYLYFFQTICLTILGQFITEHVCLGKLFLN